MSGSLHCLFCVYIFSCICFPRWPVTGAEFIFPVIEWQSLVVRLVIYSCLVRIACSSYSTHFSLPRSSVGDVVLPFQSFSYLLLFFSMFSAVFHAYSASLSLLFSPLCVCAWLDSLSEVITTLIGYYLLSLLSFSLSLSLYLPSLISVIFFSNPSLFYMSLAYSHPINLELSYPPRSFSLSYIFLRPGMPSTCHQRLIAPPCVFASALTSDTRPKAMSG